jgi:hypothetical protein
MKLTLPSLLGAAAVAALLFSASATQAQSVFAIGIKGGAHQSQFEQGLLGGDREAKGFIRPSGGIYGQVFVPLTGLCGYASVQYMGKGGRFRDRNGTPTNDPLYTVTTPINYISTDFQVRYYFFKKLVKPFIGVGLRLDNQVGDVTVEVEVDEEKLKLKPEEAGYTIDKSLLGFVGVVGLGIGRVIVEFEYNPQFGAVYKEANDGFLAQGPRILIDGSDEVKQRNYYGINIGISLFKK